MRDQREKNWSWEPEVGRGTSLLVERRMPPVSAGWTAAGPVCGVFADVHGFH